MLWYIANMPLHLELDKAIGKGRILAYAKCEISDKASKDKTDSYGPVRGEFDGLRQRLLHTNTDPRTINTAKDYETFNVSVILENVPSVAAIRKDKRETDKAKAVETAVTEQAMAQVAVDVSEEMKKLINENIGQVNELIEEKFLNLGFYLSDQEGDVDDVQVLKTPDFEIYLLCIEDNSAEFELTGSISYSAFITYDDLSTATYDSEDKILIPWHKVENTVEREEIIQANIRIKFSITEPYTFEIETVDIITPKSDVAVNAEEYEW
jgi:hypothetical protein